MARSTRRFFFAFTAVLACSVLLVTGQQPSSAGPFTAEQANAGAAAFKTNCAGCHGADLMGYPPLAGSAFVGSWGTRTTRDLFGLIQTTMPTDRPGALPADTYVNIVAFILQSNGRTDRKSTRLNSSHTVISYAVFCLKKKKKKNDIYFHKKKKKAYNRI